MSVGKAAAQAAHAEMLALEDYHSGESYAGDPQFEWVERIRPIHKEWIDSGHYTKLVMEARDENHLWNIEYYLRTRGYRTYTVVDEGRTEIDPFTKTAMAVELVDKDDERIQQHFGEFRIYKPPKPPKKKKGLLRG